MARAACFLRSPVPMLVAAVAPRADVVVGMRSHFPTPTVRLFRCPARTRAASPRRAPPPTQRPRPPGGRTDGIRRGRSDPGAEVGEACNSLEHRSDSRAKISRRLEHVFADGRPAALGREAEHAPA